MGIALALSAALIYGAADFFGGLASKRNVVWAVVFVSGVAGLATALISLPLLASGAPRRLDLELGVLIGVVGLIGIAALYRGLAIARMSVVAPITAVIAAAVPIVYGVVRGERPSLMAAAGIALALGAVALVSRTSDEDVAGDVEPQRAGLLLAVVSGIGFGLVFVLLAASSRSAWPLVASRTTFLICTGLIVLALRPRPLLAPGTILQTLLTGILDMGANVFYLFSLRFHTPVSIAAVIASLYPASTVMLARVVLHERLHAVQWAGVACAFAGVVLMARG
ncbi:MAG: DMT family transporter [Candidatus Eremiobacteraeota bacterium]|nr:DMT family transporter [Candidatus Eremiobacteraeota bacterium]